MCICRGRCRSTITGNCVAHAGIGCRHLCAGSGWRAHASWNERAYACHISTRWRHNHWAHRRNFFSCWRRASFAHRVKGGRFSRIRCVEAVPLIDASAELTSVMLEMTKVVQRQLGTREFQPRDASGLLQRQHCVAFERTAHSFITIFQVGKVLIYFDRLGTDHSLRIPLQQRATLQSPCRIPHPKSRTAYVAPTIVRARAST